ncbi:MAG: glycosyltransferase [Planctomycetota bacterium]
MTLDLHPSLDPARTLAERPLAGRAALGDDHAVRVLHVIKTIDPAGGGVPAVVACLAASQASAGHEVSVMCHPTPEADERVDKFLESTPGASGVRFVYTPETTNPFGRLPQGSDAASAIEACDVVHIHGVWDPILAVVAREARRASKPYVVMPHAMLDRWSMAQKALKKKIALALVYKKMLDCAAFIHALNTDEIRGMSPVGITARKEVIPNGVFAESFENLPGPDVFRNDRPELGDAPYVLFLSRLHYKKGLDILAGAFALALKEIPNARLVVMGPDEGGEADFREDISRLGIEDRVLITGPVYGEARFAAVTGATCFCLPSRQEGFSIAITEALACGTPVVITTECHFHEVAAAGAGRITRVQAEPVADALIDILRNPELARKLGARGRELVLDRFVWPNIAEQTIRLYRDVI